MELIINLLFVCLVLIRKNIILLFLNSHSSWIDETYLEKCDKEGSYSILMFEEYQLLHFFIVF